MTRETKTKTRHASYHLPRNRVLISAVLKTPSPSALLSGVSSIISTTVSPSPPADQPRSSLQPHDGAPLSGATELIPSKYLRPKDPAALVEETESSKSPGKSSGVNTRPHIAHLPSQLLDAPARAALNMPNSNTAPGQARAVRGGNPSTPEYEAEEALLGMNSNGNGNGNGHGHGYGGLGDNLNTSGNNHNESIPLLSPTPMRPGLSRSSSAASTSSNRGILRRIFIDRAGTPSQHLTRPTFPPPSSSTYSPIPHRPLSFLAKINLFINQTISIILSTFFLVFVVAWALSTEIARNLPKWIRRGPVKKFPWDDDRYWRKEGKKISKEPRDYARQVGMDIENQTVETEDGYLLRWVLSSIHISFTEARS